MNRAVRGLLQALLKPAGAFNQRIYRNDFNECAQLYDRAVTRSILADETLSLIGTAGLKPGMRCIDLGCGTGHSSAAILERIAPGGMLTACDFSAAMISRARSKINDPRLNTYEGDIIRFLKSLESSSVDFAGAFWSMEYCPHATTMKQVSRVLKPGGRVSILANYRDSLGELQDLVFPLLLRNPLSLRAIPPLNFLSGAREFGRIASGAGLRTIDICEKAIPFTFCSGSELVEWMRISGPCAGFRGALREGRREKIFSMVREAVDAAGGITLTFRFISYTGEK